MLNIKKSGYKKIHDYGKGSNWMGILSIGFLTLFVLIGLLILPSMFRNQIQSLTNSSLTSQIADNPEEYIGKSITMKAQIDNFVDKRAFTIGSARRVLVISSKPLQSVGGSGDTLLYNVADQVQITGLVRTLNISEIEREIGLDLNDLEFKSWIGKPVIFAQTITAQK